MKIAFAIAHEKEIPLDFFIYILDGSGFHPNRFPFRLIFNLLNRKEIEIALALQHMRIRQIVEGGMVHVILCLIELEIKKDLTLVAEHERVVAHNAMIRPIYGEWLLKLAKEGPGIQVVRPGVQVV